MRTTAILIFSRSAENECHHKMVAKTYAENIHLFEKLNEHIVALAKKTGLPFEILNEAQQCGATFGERLANGISDTFEKGYKHVIVLGNDCIQLQTSHIIHAAAALQNISLVIGPDQHGGAYLIGINKEIFDKRTFISLNWQTNRLAEDLEYYHRSVKILPVLRDINNTHSARIAATILPVSSIFHTLLASITILPASFHVIASSFFYKIYFLTQRALRAPPFLFASSISIKD